MLLLIEAVLLISDNIHFIVLLTVSHVNLRNKLSAHGLGNNARGWLSHQWNFSE